MKLLDGKMVASKIKNNIKIQIEKLGLALKKNLKKRKIFQKKNKKKNK